MFRKKHRTPSYRYPNHQGSWHRMSRRLRGPFTFTAVFLTVAACAPSTIEGLRNDHANSYEFQVNEDYQSVYRKILSAARRCYQTGLITAQMVVQGDLYSDTRTGSVTVALHGGLGVDTHMAVDVSALDEEGTQIVVFNALRTWDSAARAVRDWVEKNSTECTQRSAK